MIHDHRMAVNVSTALPIPQRRNCVRPHPGYFPIVVLVMSLPPLLATILTGAASRVLA
jgi:hypothetical protein